MTGSVEPSRPFEGLVSPRIFYCASSLARGWATFKLCISVPCGRATTAPPTSRLERSKSPTGHPILFPSFWDADHSESSSGSRGHAFLFLDDGSCLATCWSCDDPAVRQYRTRILPLSLHSSPSPCGSALAPA